MLGKAAAPEQVTMTGAKIAVLGCGSLLWEDGGVFDTLHEPW
jgi:hypothetical protein